MISEGLMEKLSVTGLCDDSRRVNCGWRRGGCGRDDGSRGAHVQVDSGARREGRAP